jgi:mannose-6-phosphate isomerase-like protein (cupin superfamily)
MSDDEIRLGEREVLRVLHEDPELLALEATYEPGGSAPPAHFHPAQDEHFEVLEGGVRCKTPDGERDLRAGETIDIPRETVHQFWNPGDEPARVRWEVRPALRTRSFFSAIAAAPELEDKIKVVVAHDDVFRLGEL